MRAAPVNAPKLSLIVIIHRMSRQAENTLYSLSARFQRNVVENDYEIIAVENDSDDELGERRALAQGSNIRFFSRRETGVSPVPALNFGFEQSRAPFVGFIIDGARMVTPRTIELALAASRIWTHPLVVVPGYHLGEKEHHYHQSSGYGDEVEQQLLEKIDWKNDGYRLFAISCFSGANPRGFFTQFLESNCFFCSRESFEKIGRADERFNLPGGGSVNIFLYHALARLPESRLVVLAGEGSFHQFHGGVTTIETEDREERLQTHRANIAEIFGGPFKGMHREPLVLGALPDAALSFLKASAEHAATQYSFCKARGVSQWQTPELDQA
jgi:glycosyltransferase involved in cell wall biosynthesis